MPDQSSSQSNELALTLTEIAAAGKDKWDKGIMSSFRGQGKGAAYPLVIAVSRVKAMGVDRPSLLWRVAERPEADMAALSS